MKTFFKWVVRLIAGLIGFVALVLATVFVLDSAILRNLFGGPPMGVVTETSRNGPQETVAGTESDVPSAPADMFDPAALSAAEEYAARTDSVALIVYQGGAIRYEKYWAGYDRNTITDPFSSHKTVMALLMGAAIADGYVKSVDEPVATYIPEFAKDDRKTIRIRDLLQMSSGIEVPRFGGWTSLRINVGSDLTSVVQGLQAEKPPGTEFQYTNGSAELAGIVIQNAVGKRYAQYLAERLWSRIGAAPAAVWLDREGGMPRTFCCLYTTGRSWLQVGRLILNQGRVGDDQVIPAEWIRAMTTPAATNPNYGFQIWLGSPPGKERRYNDKTVKAFHSEPFVANDIVYIDGFGGQRVYIVPSKELIIVRTGRAQFEWDDAVIPNAILRGLKLPAAGGDTANPASASDAGGSPSAQPAASGANATNAAGVAP
jgi:CubicO group peptidase (beta-lactamase class C family)